MTCEVCGCDDGWSDVGVKGFWFSEFTNDVLTPILLINIIDQGEPCLNWCKHCRPDTLAVLDEYRPVIQAWLARSSVRINRLAINYDNGKASPPIEREKFELDTRIYGRRRRAISAIIWKHA